jgi:hypothetical protein
LILDCNSGIIARGLNIFFVEDFCKIISICIS